MIEELNKLPQDSRIYVTGHSLGDEFATLAIPDILQNTKFKSSQITLYTFASPRCGDRKFADEFTKTLVQH
jgi:predicted lipase